MQLCVLGSVVAVVVVAVVVVVVVVLSFQVCQHELM